MLFLKLEEDIIRNKNDNTVNESQESVLDKFTRFIFHRIHERTFDIRRYYLTESTNISGFYISVFSYFIFIYFYYVQYIAELVLIAILTMFPTVLDGFTKLRGAREINNILRLLTGFFRCIVLNCTTNLKLNIQIVEIFTK